jgi:hypothetical protein
MMYGMVIPLAKDENTQEALNMIANRHLQEYIENLQFKEKPPQNDFISYKR